MKHLIVVLLFLVFFPVALQAQSNYKSGFVVTTAGDTLKGFINYQEWHQAPTSISFKATEESPNKREFNVSTARYFEITSVEAYRRYEGPVTMNEVDIRKMSTDRDLHVVTDKVFLKELNTGVNVSLLSYRNHIKIRYFIQEKNDSIPQELYFIKYYASGPGNKMLTMKSYVGQLLTVASKYVEVTPELQREIEAAAYKTAPLQKIISRINGKSDAEISLELEQENKYRFYAGVAVNRTVIQFKGESGFTGAEHNPASYLPRLAFGVDAFINRNTQRLLLRMEGNLASSNHYIETSAESQYTLHYYSYEIAQQTVSLSPQVIYNLYNKDSFKFYVGGGFILNYSN